MNPLNALKFLAAAAGIINVDSIDTQQRLKEADSQRRPVFFKRKARAKTLNRLPRRNAKQNNRMREDWMCFRGISRLNVPFFQAK